MLRRHGGSRLNLAGTIALLALLVGVLAPASAAATEPPQGFDDVPVGHQFYESIMWMADAGITTGYADGTFGPTVVVSRQAAAAFAYRLWQRTGLDDPPPATAPTFSDVGETHPFHTEITWAAAAGITTGYADGTFRPTEPVSRQALAAFTYRLWQLTGLDDPTRMVHDPTFPDVPASHAFHHEITWLVATGKATGYDDNTFRPTTVVSRQAAAAWMHRWWLAFEVASDTSQPGDHYVVDTEADGVDAEPGDGLCATAQQTCTLRAAIGEANARPGPHTISFAEGIETITLTLEDPDLTWEVPDPDNDLASLAIAADLVIDGHGVTLDADGIDRAIWIHDGDVTINGLTITGGEPTDIAGGAGILTTTAGTVRLDDLTVTDNHTWAAEWPNQDCGGGALSAMAGHLHLANSRVSLNTLGEGCGAGVHVSQAGTTATIVDTTIVDNAGVDFDQNESYGGGLAVTWEAEVTVERTEISNNTAYNGGGVAVILASLVLRDAVVAHNTDEEWAGGIVVMFSHLVLERSTVHDNSGNVGGISAITDGVGPSPGPGSLTLHTSTITGNQGTGTGGVRAEMQSTIIASTIADNTTASLWAPSQLYVDQPSTVSGSIISGDGHTCESHESSLNSLGYNVVSDDSCEFDHATDQIDTDPLLGPLADNGGPTPTRLPEPGSPVVDAIPSGTDTLCDATTPIDQRGLPRPNGAGCDIGAVER